MEFQWEKHQKTHLNYPLWFKELHDIRVSTGILSQEQLLLYALTAQKVEQTLDNFDWAMGQLKETPPQASYHLAQFFYLRALEERSFNRLQEALEMAKKSIASAQGSKFALIAKCLYALYLTELKKIHMGMEIFQEILEEEALPTLAREAAISNLTSFSIELGIGSLLQRYEKEGDETTKFRSMIFQAIAQEDHQKLAAIVKQCPIDPEMNQVSLSVMDLVIYGFLCGDEALLKNMRRSWIEKFLSEHKHNQLYKRAYTLLMDDMPQSFPPESSPSWFAQSRLNFFDMLIHLARGETDLAVSTLKGRVSPLAEDLRINNPILPHLSYGRIVPDSYLARRLSQILREVSLPVVQEKVLLSGTSVCYQNGDIKIEVDLSKSLKSLTVLRVIAGVKGKETSKEQLHNALSDIPYHPLEHDSRLHKLIDRLQSKLRENGFPDLWHKPGENNIVLNLDIESI